MSRHANQRPGFALAFVLLLLLISSLMIAVGLQRASVQAKVNRMRVDGYHEYHELMSIVDIVEIWIKDHSDRDEIVALAASGGQRAVIRLKDDIRLEIRITDGQGTVLARLDKVNTDDQADWLIYHLQSFGPAAKELTRKAGTFRISFNGIRDDRIIEALADGDAELYDALRETHAERPETRADFERELQTRGVQ